MCPEGLLLLVANKEIISILKLLEDLSAAFELITILSSDLSLLTCPETLSLQDCLSVN